MSTEIQKLKTTGDHAIDATSEVVIFRAGVGMTQALLPNARANLARSILCVRGNESTSPGFVNRVVPTGDDQILLPGTGLVSAVELSEYGDSVVMQAIEAGVWHALVAK